LEANEEVEREACRKKLTGLMKPPRHTWGDTVKKKNPNPPDMCRRGTAHRALASSPRRFDGCESRWKRGIWAFRADFWYFEVAASQMLIVTLKII